MESSTPLKMREKGKCKSGGGGGGECMVDGCSADLSECKEYHRRHKVCQLHSKTPKVTIGGMELRFCQQCSRFQSLVEFDDGKRSCRKRLEGHNRRRRKSSQCNNKTTTTTTQQPAATWMMQQQQLSYSNNMDAEAAAAAVMNQNQGFQVDPNGNHDALSLLSSPSPISPSLVDYALPHYHYTPSNFHFPSTPPNFHFPSTTTGSGSAPNPTLEFMWD